MNKWVMSNEKVIRVKIYIVDSKQEWVAVAGKKRFDPSDKKKSQK